MDSMRHFILGLVKVFKGYFKFVFSFVNLFVVLSKKKKFSTLGIHQNTKESVQLFLNPVYIICNFTIIKLLYVSDFDYKTYSAGRKYLICFLENFIYLIIVMFSFMISLVHRSMFSYSKVCTY